MFSREISCVGAAPGAPHLLGLLRGSRISDSIEENAQHHAHHAKTLVPNGFRAKDALPAASA
jgi:hypothetical protein